MTNGDTMDDCTTYQALCNFVWTEKQDQTNHFLESVTKPVFWDGEPDFFCPFDTMAVEQCCSVAKNEIFIREYSDVLK